MKGKYITTQIRLACLASSRSDKKVLRPAEENIRIAAVSKQKADLEAAKISERDKAA